MIRALAACLGAATLLATALAQTGRTFDSIEGLVAMSDQACIGRVTSIERAGDRDPSTHLKPVRVQLAVTEWICGGGPKTLDILLASPGNESDIKTIHDLQIEIMLTIGTPHGRGYPLLKLGGMVIPGRSCYFRFIEKLPKGAPQVPTYQYDDGHIFDLDLNAVTDRRQFLARARSYQKKHPEPLSCLWLQLPNAFLKRVGDPNAYGGIHLPVCSETRRTLLRILKNPEFVLAQVTADHAWQRRCVLVMAVRVLEPFKDEETLALVRRFAREGDPPSNPPKGQTASGYDVQQEAQGLLEQWSEHPNNLAGTQNLPERPGCR